MSEPHAAPPQNVGLEPAEAAFPEPADHRESGLHELHCPPKLSNPIAEAATNSPAAPAHEGPPPAPESASVDARTSSAREMPSAPIEYPSTLAMRPADRSRYHSPTGHPEPIREETDRAPKPRRDSKPTTPIGEPPAPSHRSNDQALIDRIEAVRRSGSRRGETERDSESLPEPAGRGPGGAEPSRQPKNHTHTLETRHTPAPPHRSNHQPLTNSSESVPGPGGREPEDARNSETLQEPTGRGRGGAEPSRRPKNHTHTPETRHAPTSSHRSNHQPAINSPEFAPGPGGAEDARDSELREATGGGRADVEPSLRSDDRASGARLATGVRQRVRKSWWWGPAGIGAVGVAVFVVGQPVAGAAVGSPVGENSAARVAVAELTGAHPGNAVLPADFAAERGYRPVLAGGLLVDPGGDCSSPVRLPAEFRTACRAHDLGYDLLRYADDRGQPLGPWARQAIDAVLEQRMLAACDDRHGLHRAQCRAMAAVAGTAVDLNSRRQNYATPRAEYLFGIRLAGEHLGYQFLAIGAPAALVLSAVALLLAEIVRGRRRRKPTSADRTETTR